MFLRYGLRAFHITLAAGCLYLIYSMVTSFLSPTELAELRIPSVEELPPSQPSFARYEIVGERNLFERRETAPLAAPPPPPEEELEKSQLRLRLLGTIAGPDHLSVATVEDETSREHLHLRVNDQVGEHENVTVARIERMRLVLNNNGKLEAITMEEPETTTRPKQKDKRREQTSSNRRGRARGARNADRAASQRERLMERVNRLKSQKRQLRRSRPPTSGQAAVAHAKNLLAQVRFAPAFDSDGNLDGIQVTEVLPGPLQESGLQSGDVIVAVNGVAISGPNDLPKILPSLAEGRRSCLNTKAPDGTQATHCWDN